MTSPLFDEFVNVSMRAPNMQLSWTSAACTSRFVHFQLCSRLSGGQPRDCINTVNDTIVFQASGAVRNTGSARLPFAAPPSRGSGHYVVRVVDDEDPSVQAESEVFWLEFFGDWSSQRSSGDSNKVSRSSRSELLHVLLVGAGGGCVCSLLLAYALRRFVCKKSGHMTKERNTEQEEGEPSDVFTPANASTSDAIAYLSIGYSAAETEELVEGAKKKEQPRAIDMTHAAIAVGQFNGAAFRNDSSI